MSIITTYTYGTPVGPGASDICNVEHSGKCDCDPKAGFGDSNDVNSWSSGGVGAILGPGFGLPGKSGSPPPTCGPSGCGTASAQTG